MSISAKDIRNIAIIGHSGEGKTTLCEAILFNGGSIDRMGKVLDGNTVMDFDEQEIQRKMSVNLACANTTWKGVKINLLDLPGFYDFEGERHEGLSAAGGALLVIGANGVIPIGAESVVDYCLRLSKPLIIFINGMDKDNADYVGTVEALREKYHSKLAPIQLPIIRDGKMQGYVNALSEKAFEFTQTGPKEIPIPEDMKESLAAMQAQLTETAAENDDILLDKFFEEGELTKEEIIHGIRRGIATMNTIPVMAGSALQNKGVINLMNEIVQYMPAASDRSAMLATDLKEDKMTSIVCEDNAPVAAQVFKTVIDPYAGKISYVKIYRGSLKSGTVLFNARAEQEEKIGLIYQLKGKKLETVSEAAAGDIVALGKLPHAITGDTLCDAAHPVLFDNIRFPKPVLTMAVFAEVKGEEDKIFQGLQRLADEDYTFSITKSKVTGEMLLSGQGETQIEVLCKRLKSKFGVNVVLKEPSIEYKETIRATATAEGKHKKQSGGHGQYGHCKMRFEPCEEEFVFAEEVIGGAVPKQYIPAVEKGIRECLSTGVLAGYPVTGLKAVLFDGSYHDVDSSEMAFKMAASIAFKEGLKNAKPALLEPIMKLKVVIPEEYFGAVMGDIVKRRGRIMGTDVVEGKTVLSAEAPQSELMKYATDLRSATQGKGKFVAEFIRYEEVPDMLLTKILKK
ncbi:MAG: elongation factor G [Clostridia bacterium]|nr:elongation factor G [Clostridia bacterium]